MPLTIALVDDSPTIRQALRTFFESNTDWTICGEAENGATAIELVQRLRPDLMVLDLSMPVVNGFDAARNIGVISPGTAVVLFTAHSTQQLIAEARGIGIRAVVQKDGNGTLQVLLNTLREAAGPARAA